MSSDSITRVGVVGAGQMGAGIAEVSARAGVDVKVFEKTEALVTAGRNRIVKSLERGVSSGKVTERERDRAIENLTFTTELKDLSDRQLVIEAVIEDEAVKAEIFSELDAVIEDRDAVLASNTSSIPIMKIAAATRNPQRVLGLHFFNPVPVLPLVELVSTLVTSEAAAARTEEFAGSVLGKQVRINRAAASRAPCWASRSSGAQTGRASSSTRCWCRICCPPYEWPRPAWRPWRTSTRPSSRGCRTRWGPCGCRT